MAATTDQLIVAQEPCSRRSFPVAASISIPQGTLVFATAGGGFATNAVATGGNHFLGVAIASADNSAGSNGDIQVECYTSGSFELPGSSLAQALVGDKIYAPDNYTVSGTSTDSTLIGRCDGFVSSTKIRVKLETGLQA